MSRIVADFADFDGRHLNKWTILSQLTYTDKRDIIRVKTVNLPGVLKCRTMFLFYRHIKRQAGKPKYMIGKDRRPRTSQFDAKRGLGECLYGTTASLIQAGDGATFRQK